MPLLAVRLTDHKGQKAIKCDGWIQHDKTLIERYTLPEMGELWTEAYKLKTWLQVEIAVCEAQAELGYIPAAAVDEIKAKASFDPQRVLEIEQEVKHDVIAFLTNVNEFVGDAGRYIHLGMTSSDLLDTALALQMVASLDVIMQHVEDLIQAIRYQAQQHRNTLMIGRSHGIHAEPITFGFKLAGWLAEMLRHRERLCELHKRIAVGKISGAVGTYANIDPQIEALTCQKLGLDPDAASTQVISRDRTPNSSMRWHCWQPRSSGLPSKSAISSARMFWKLKNFSRRDKKAPPRCRTNATRFDRSA